MAGQAIDSASAPKPEDAGGAGAARRCADIDSSLAVVLPAGVVLLAGLAVWAVMVVAAHLRCVDAVGAWALARGESRGQVEAVVGQLAPPGARVRLSRDGDLVVVEVRARVRLPGPWALSGPGVEVGDEAVAVAEAAGGSMAPSRRPRPRRPRHIGRRRGTERSVP